MTAVISNFADQASEDIFNGVESKKARFLPKSLWPIARRKLDMIDAAQSVTDLRVPPGNRLEALHGDLAGKFSIRINDQFRIVFTFGEGTARDVQIIDYH
jgi:proteic killer suppression protein